MRASSVVLVKQRFPDGYVMKPNSYLCVWNSKFQTWCLPGGKIDEGESPDQAARRELFEETGLVAKGELQLIYQAVSVGPEDFRVFLFDCETTAPIAHYRSIKCEYGSAYRWMALDRLAEVSKFGAFYTNAQRDGHWALTLTRG